MQGLIFLLDFYLQRDLPKHGQEEGKEAAQP